MNAYSIISAYYAAGAVERADVLLEDYANTLQEYIEYYLRFDGVKAELVADEWTNKVRMLDALSRLAALFGRTAQYEAIDSYLDMFGPAEDAAPGDVQGDIPVDTPADTLPPPASNS
jgi:flavin-dependent dehydrogenase